MKNNKNKSLCFLKNKIRTATIDLMARTTLKIIAGESDVFDNQRSSRKTIEAIRTSATGQSSMRSRVACVPLGKLG
jgi:hypothetical protein